MNRDEAEKFAISTAMGALFDRLMPGRRRPQQPPQQPQDPWQPPEFQLPNHAVDKIAAIAAGAAFGKFLMSLRLSKQELEMLIEGFLEGVTRSLGR